MSNIMWSNCVWWSELRWVYRFQHKNKDTFIYQWLIRLYFYDFWMSELRWAYRIQDQMWRQSYTRGWKFPALIKAIPFCQASFLQNHRQVGHGQRGPGEQGVGEGAMSYGAQSMRDVWSWGSRGITLDLVDWQSLSSSSHIADTHQCAKSPSSRRHQHPWNGM